MTRKIAKPMTAQDRAVLRAAILLALKESGPTTIAALEVVTGMSEKRCYRDLLALQASGEVVRRGVGKATRYLLKLQTDTQFVDNAIRDVQKKTKSSSSWWVDCIDREAFNAALRARR